MKVLLFVLSNLCRLSKCIVTWSPVLLLSMMFVVVECSWLLEGIFFFIFPLMRALHALFYYSADNTLRIWGLGPGVRGRQRLRRSSVRQWTQQPLPARPVRTLHGHVSCVACLCASADLDVVVSGGANGLCVIHRLSQGVILHVISPDHSLGTPVAIRGMVLSQDGEVIMMLGDRSLRTVDVNSNTTGMVANPSEGLVSNICLSSDGHVVFISGKEGPITACSARTLVSAGCLPAEAAVNDGSLITDIVPALCLAISPCGGYLFAGLANGCVDVFVSSSMTEQVSCDVAIWLL